MTRECYLQNDINIHLEFKVKIALTNKPQGP